MSPKFHTLNHRLQGNIQRDDLELIKEDLLDLLVELNEIGKIVQRAKEKAEAEQIFETCGNPAHFVQDPYEAAKGKT